MDHSMMEHAAKEGAMIMPGVPLWLYLVGIGAVILLTFGATLWLGPRLAAVQFRVDLSRNRKIYKVLKSRWLQPIPQLTMVAIFGGLVYIGLFGSRVRNLTPAAVWTVWWAGLIFTVLVLASVWCFVCPWDGLANLATRLRLAARVESLSLGLKYPKWLENTYPALALFALLTWLELGYDVTTDPRATAYLGLGMAAMAIGAALLWDGKRFCAHFCPVGRICGIYSTFSPIEIRRRKQGTCEACTTEDCLYGNELGYACPTGLSLKSLESSAMCTMCTECFKSCRKHNVAINLRPFGADLQSGRSPRLDQAWLAVMLLALTLFHGLTMTLVWENFEPGRFSILKTIGQTLGIGRDTSFTLAMLFAVALPIAVYALCCWAAAAWAGSGVDGRRLFSAFAYSLLPVALFYHLAHNLMHLLAEGSHVVPLLSDPLGTGADLFGTAGFVPGPVVSDTTLWILQVTLVVVGHVFGVVAGHRVANRLYGDRRAAARSLVPMTVMMVIVSIVGLSLMHMDMAMRMGRM